ncbi:MAG: pirin family protein [Burkholderiales bacterium]
MNALSPDLDAVIVPRSTDLGDGFTVRRALPALQHRMVGPFVFFDAMGPAQMPPGHGLDVRPHPHIGLATVTYLFDGEILHRDSLGSVQVIRPGEVNWMTAGRGIAHSERTPSALRRVGARLAGAQVWVALPKAHEETDPAFVHHAEDALPLLEGDGTRVRLVVGSWQGQRSPVATFAETFYADVQLQPGARLPLPREDAERAAYVVSGQVQVGSGAQAPVFGADQLLVFGRDRDIVLAADGGPARLLVFGGEPMDGPRHLWWNFVSSSQERIEQAKADWQAGRFGRVPNEMEFIPLPT